MPVDNVSENVSRFLYDWLSFTTKLRSDEVGKIIALLGLDGVPWETLYSLHGYKNRLYFQGISIHYDSDNDDQWIWVELSGAGCRSFESFGTGDYDSIFLWIAEEYQYRHLTRLDVAYDDRDDMQVINLSKFWTALEDRYYVSRSGWKREDGSDGSMCVYLGSQKSDHYFRIYDKAVERGLTVAPLDAPDDWQPPHWVRLEMQMRDDVAGRFVLDDRYIGQKLFDALLTSWRFVQEPDGDDTDRRRWPLADWYVSLVDGARSVSYFSRPGVDYNLGRLERSVISSMGCATLCYATLIGSYCFREELEKLRPKMEANPKYKELLRLYDRSAISGGAAALPGGSAR